MKKNILMTLGVLFGSVAVHAQEVNCTMGKLTRNVLVETSSGSSCNTIYKKPNEGVEDQVIWSSDFSTENCEKKADRMLERLAGWGWNCDRLSYAGVPVMAEPTVIEEATTEEKPSSLLDRAKAAGAAAVNKAGEAAGGATGATGSMMDKVKAAGSSVMDKAGEAAGGTKSATGSMLDKAKAAGSSATGSMLDKAKAAGSSATGSMLDKAKAVGSSAMDKAGDAAKATGGVGSKMMEKVKDGAVKTMEKVPANP